MDTKQSEKSEKSSQSFLTFRHLHLPWIGKSAVVTAAMRIREAENSTDHLINIAFAFCSPKQGTPKTVKPGTCVIGKAERPFTKKTGRKIAETRLGGSRSVEVRVDEYTSRYTVAFRGLMLALAQRNAAKKSHSLEPRDGVDAFSHWVPHWLVDWIKDRAYHSSKEISDVIKNRWEKERAQFLAKREEGRLARKAG